MPNADFCVVSSEETFLIIKRFERLDVEVPTEANMAKPICRQVGKSDGAWTRHSRNLHMVTGRLLELPDEVLTATLADRPLNARTEFVLADGAQVMSEYPVKTINVSERDRYYQVDTARAFCPIYRSGTNRLWETFDWPTLPTTAPTGPNWWSTFLLPSPRVSLLITTRSLCVWRPKTP